MSPLLRILLSLGCAEPDPSEAVGWLDHQVSTSGEEAVAYHGVARFRAQPLSIAPAGYLPIEIEHDPLQGIDDCSLVEIIGEAWQGDLNPPVSAGEVYLQLDGVDHLLEPVLNPPDFQSIAMYRHTGDAPVSNEPALFYATGGDFAGFEPVELSPLPATLGALEPAQEGVLPRDATFRWNRSGGGGIVHLDLIASIPLELPGWRVRCDITDDGEFTLPTHLFEPVPSGLRVSWSLQRVDVSAVRLADGRVVSITAGSHHHSDSSGHTTLE